MFKGLFGGGKTPGSPSADERAAQEQRQAQWQQAIETGQLPEFVNQRMRETAAGKRPWISTMTPSELALSRTHGIRPLGYVSGNCWFHYGNSWTEGHRAGWQTAQARLLDEARLLGAHAVVDVTLKTSHFSTIDNSMDYAVRGTAICIDGLPPSTQPIVATVNALEFVRLLELGVVPTGLAIGAHFAWLDELFPGPGFRADLAGTWSNKEADRLSQFVEGVRRAAIADLRHDAMKQGTGVLGNTEFFEIFRIEANNRPMNFGAQVDGYLGRYISMGTVIQHEQAPRTPWYASDDERKEPNADRRLHVGVAIDLAEPSPLTRDRLASEQETI